MNSQKKKVQNQFLAQEKNSKLNTDAKKISKASIKEVKDIIDNSTEKELEIPMNKSTELILLNNKIKSLSLNFLRNGSKKDAQVISIGLEKVILVLNI